MDLRCWARSSEALAVFRNEPAVWRRIQINGMAKDFSWQAIRDRICKAVRSGLEIQKPKSSNYI